MPNIVPVPAVNGAVFNKRGKILLTRRAPAIRAPGKWCLPGGRLDGGERWQTALRRELLEEVGVKVLEETLIGIYSDPQLTVTQNPLPEGYYGQFVVASFLIKKYEGEIIPNEEVDRWDWFSLEALPEPMLRSHPVRIRDAFNYVGQVFIR